MDIRSIGLLSHISDVYVHVDDVPDCLACDKVDRLDVNLNDFDFCDIVEYVEDCGNHVVDNDRMYVIAIDVWIGGEFKKETIILNDEVYKTENDAIDNYLELKDEYGENVYIKEMKL